VAVAQAKLIEPPRDSGAGHRLRCIPFENLPDERRLGCRRRSDDDPVGLHALVLVLSKRTSLLAFAVKKDALQSVAGRPTSMKSALSVKALPEEDLAGHLPAEFRGHRPLERLDDGGRRTAVICKRLGHIHDVDTRAPARVFIKRRLVNILETSPSAYVEDKHFAELVFGVFNIEQKLHKRGSLPEGQSADTRVLIVADDADVVCACLLGDSLPLEYRRIFLMVGRHADVLGGTYAHESSCSTTTSRRHIACPVVAQVSDSVFAG